MAHDSGKSAWIVWRDVEIHGDYRTFKASGKTSTADTTAGADDDESHLLLTTSFNFDFSALWEDSAAGGTILDELATGTQGTLRFAPSGSVAGNKLWECSASIVASDIPLDYGKEIEVSAQFLRNGAWLTNGYSGGTIT